MPAIQESKQTPKVFDRIFFLLCQSVDYSLNKLSVLSGRISIFSVCHYQDLIKTQKGKKSGMANVFGTKEKKRKENLD